MFCTLHPLFAEFEVPKIEPPENRIVRYLQTKDSFVFRTWLQACKSKLDNYSLPSTLLPGNGDNRGSLQFRYFAGCEALHVLDSLCCKIVREMRNPEARHKAHTLHRTARSFTPVLDRCPHES